jgi:hypothetical protein
MSSKTSLWQARWEVFPKEGLAIHDSGLRVRLRDGQAAAENHTEIANTLIPVHGSHNALAMVQRLTREGAQLLIDPYARGWRGGPKIV